VSLCSQKPPTADSRPSLLCGPLRLSNNGTAWNEVWAAIPESDPQVLDLQGSNQVRVTIPMLCDGSAFYYNSLESQAFSIHRRSRSPSWCLPTPAV
jgi:hypothetical protein